MTQTINKSGQRLARHLANAFKLIDGSVAAAIKDSSLPPACGKGCSACCRQPIPLTPLELLAIMEHVRLNWTSEKRNRFLIPVLANEHLLPTKRDCPFLYQNSCSIYSLRPIACRRFIVAGEKCRAGENPADSRPLDMIVPDRKVLQEALLNTFPWYKANSSKYGLPTPANGLSDKYKLEWLKNITTIIQAANWKNIFSAQRPET